MTTLGERLKELRTERGETQHDAATYTGIARSQIGAWEVNLSCPSLWNARKLLNHYQATFEDLLSGVEVTPRKQTGTSGESTQNR